MSIPDRSGSPEIMFRAEAESVFRQVWGGAIPVCGGLFMLDGVRTRGGDGAVGRGDTGSGHGLDCENIPAGEEAPEFFNSVAGLIGGSAPPYPPAVLLLPFTLVIAYLLLKVRIKEA
ncbi:MAG: hypothetical protein ACXQTG_05265 [Methanoculleaceae archaeon]